MFFTQKQRLTYCISKNFAVDSLFQVAAANDVAAAFSQAVELFTPSLDMSNCLRLLSTKHR